MLPGLVQSIKRTFWYSAPAWRSPGEFLPPVHVLNWWRLGALVPRCHPVTVVTSSCVIPHQSVVEGNKHYLHSSAPLEHHSTTALSPEPAPDLNRGVLQSLRCLGFLFVLNWPSLHCIAVEENSCVLQDFTQGGLT